MVGKLRRSDMGNHIQCKYPWVKILNRDTGIDVDGKNRGDWSRQLQHSSIEAAITQAYCGSTRRKGAFDASTDSMHRFT